MPLIISVSSLWLVSLTKKLNYFLALDYEGIYRKSGGSGLSKTITQLFERGDYNAFDLRDNDRFNDISSVTSVLKNYFRSLPTPLLTYDLNDQFLSAATMKDESAKDKALTELVQQLPGEHWYTTRAMIMHLHRYGQKIFLSVRRLTTFMLDQSK